MEITLRSNQIAPVEAGIKFFATPKAVPSVIIAPTAFGKSVVIAKIVESVQDKLLVICPSKELLAQNIEKYRLCGGKASIYSASFNSSKISDVTYATIGSIKNLGKLFKEKGFTKMLIDESHLMPREADSMIGKFLLESGITHVLGLTATPLKLQTNTDIYGNSFSKLVMLTSRSKKGNFFKNIIYCAQIKEMVELGFWSKLEYELYDVDQTGLVYNSTKADFTEASLQKMYKLNNTNDRIKHAIEVSDRKCIIVFVPSVAEAKKLSEQIPSSVCVYAEMDSASRDWAISGFRSGRIRVLINVNIAAIGFDEPKIDLIIMGRTTASLAWFYQALGRGTRIFPTKIDCKIIDFSGNVRRFGKIEGFYYVNEGGKWKLYGEGGVLLTGIPIHEIGKHTHQTEAEVKKIIMTFGVHKGVEVKDVPKSYRDWALLNCTWNDYNAKIKKEMERLKSVENISPQNETLTYKF
jgi:DNA repair protein RadD